MLFFRHRERPFRSTPGESANVIDRNEGSVRRPFRAPGFLLTVSNWGVAVTDDVAGQKPHSCLTVGHPADLAFEVLHARHDDRDRLGEVQTAIR